MADGAMKPRIAWIDTAKGIGIFFVVLGHALPDGHLTATVIWTFHMPLFFFLSGLTIRPWGAGPRGSFLRSLKNLAIPYLFFSVVAIVLWQALHCSIATLQHCNILPWDSSSSWVNLLGQMAYGVAGPDQKMGYDVPLWFFTCLFSIRLLFALVTAFARKLRTVAMVVALVALFAHLVVFPHVRTLPWNMDVALVGLLFYTAGFIFSQKLITESGTATVATGRSRAVYFVIALALIATAAFLNGRVDMNGREFGNFVVFYAGAFAGIYAAIVLAGPLSRFAWIGALGRASIVIFPLHTIWPELPSRLMPLMKWYGYRLTRAELGGALAVATVEIILCLPIYFALKRWAPRLIGLATARPATPMSSRAQRTGV